MMFSSRPPYNDDPWPYITKHDASRHAYPGTLGGERLIYTPRPEFDRPQTNPTNPILAEFRSTGETQGARIWMLALDRPWLYSIYGERTAWNAGADQSRPPRPVSSREPGQGRIMTYRDVTLAPDDVEWSTDRPTNPVKEAVFDDDAFRSILTDKGARETLELFHKFHRDVANQLIAQAVTDARESDWTRRAVNLCRGAKVRRDVARRVFQVEHGVTAELEFRQGLRRKYPRAVWGSDMEET